MYYVPCEQKKATEKRTFVYGLICKIISIYKREGMIMCI